MILFWYGKRLCGPNDYKFKKEIMEKGHRTAYVVHPGSTKMYKDLKEYYWGNNMERKIIDFVSKCFTCQLVKAEHQRPAGFVTAIGNS